jgi:hypothetical protein
MIDTHLEIRMYNRKASIFSYPGLASIVQARWHIRSHVEFTASCPFFQLFKYCDCIRVI